MNNNPNIPYIIGVGPGDPAYIYPLAQELIAQAEVLIGGRRNLAELPEAAGRETLVIDRGLAQVAAYIRENWQSRRLVVLASGDTSLFSVRAYLQKALPEVPFGVLPGISSLQYLLARRGLNLNELKIISMHGASNANLLNTVMRERACAIFTGGGNSPQAIAQRLTQLPFAELTLTVGENLSYPDERLTTGSPQEIAQGEFAPLSLLLAENARPEQRPWPYLSAGLPDELFLRDLGGEGGRAVPMTKSEVRAVITSKLRLRENSRLLEIGSGTGSVTVEAALAAYAGHVWTLEQNPQAAELCWQNILRFGLDNVTLIEGFAPECLPPAPPQGYDSLFIGGGSGYLAKILAEVCQQSQPLRIVISAIMLETVAEAMAALQQAGCTDLEIVQVAVARSKEAGRGHLLLGQNPITIIAANKN